ncbi:hypothetical protein CSB08_00155 [Candidatus Gracilibacteria bacterium]|nr:MAG: hypothetical protein CSB08_00155 [Candidatus Gracilibacteria bacterium]PIE85257.1 MAG: hypothetical protein CSA08_02505 [Candidatus Gracilibacteria bacterium]
MEYLIEFSYLDTQKLILLEKINDLFGEDYDISLINKALNIAEKGHEGQKRKSGEEYISHPIRVAIKLVNILGSKIEKELLREIIVVSLLHDIIEDSFFDQDEIERSFGSIVAISVGLLSKNFWFDYVGNYEDYEKIIYLKKLGFVDDELNLTLKAKEIKKSDDLKCKNLINDFEENKNICKKRRNEDYFYKLQLLEEGRYEELEMGNLNKRQKDYVRNIVLPVKGIDRLDNLETMSGVEAKSIVTKVKETIDKIIPTLSDWPPVVDELRKNINSIVNHRLIYLERPGE